MVVECVLLMTSMWREGTYEQVDAVECRRTPPFPSSQALSNVKTVATTPWEGPALSHFCGAWQWYKADHWDKVSICEWFQHWQNNCSKLVLMFFVLFFFLHNYSDLRFLLSSPLIKPDIFSQTRSSWILAGWLNGTAQQKEDLSLIQGTRLALKEPRNQDHKTGNGSPMFFSQRHYSPF